MPETVRKATAGDVDRLVVALSRAFDADPVANYLIRQDAKRAQGFAGLFRTCLRKLSLRHGEVLAANDCAGGALWYPPGTAKIGFFRQLSLLPAIIRGSSLRGVPRFMRFMDRVEAAHPTEEHFYLQFIGVDPELRRRGLGTALMQPVLGRCDQRGCGAYLENSNEANLPFYSRFGFRVTGELDLGPTAPPMWSMWRDPN